MQKAETWRLFVAIVLPEGVKDEVEKAQGELRRGLAEPGVRWTKRTQFHLTLKFLGDVEAQRLAALTGALQSACREFPALQLRAERVGFFPDPRHPRVVWAGVQDAAGVLPRLQAAIESAAGDFTSQEPEGKFTGHVTLGRCKGIQRPQAEILAQLAGGLGRRVFGAWTADKVEIIRSELRSAGAHYTTLAAVPLAGEGGSGALPS